MLTSDGSWMGLLLAAAVLLAAGAMGVALVVFHRRGRALRDTPSRACGECGYDVRGLPSFICPECGSDLREVGIIRGSPPGALLLLAMAMGSGWKRLLVATLGVGALVAGIGFIAITFVLRHNVYPASDATLQPASGSYRVLLVMSGKQQAAAGRFAARADKVQGQNISIRLGPPNGVIDYNTDLHVDLATWSSKLYRWLAGKADIPPQTQFNRGELEKLFQASGIDPTPAAVAEEITSLWRLIDACKSDLVHRVAGSAGGFTVVSSSDRTTVEYAGPGPLGGPLLSIGAAIWLLTITGLVIARMWKLRDGAPTRTLIGRDEWPASAGDVSAPAATARTVTVLFSDIKDFTARSAAADRTGAIELVRRHRDIAGPIIRQRRGALVKTIGDALLVTFESATDAALAGLEIQSAVAAHNAATADDGLQLRIAVASGEVIVEAGDVYGESVNLAARLQTIVSPGQVVLSAATRSLVNQREVGVEPFGEHRLAGFASPVSAFIARPIAVDAAGG